MPQRFAGAFLFFARLNLEQGGEGSFCAVFCGDFLRCFFGLLFASLPSFWLGTGATFKAHKQKSPDLAIEAFEYGAQKRT